MPVTADLYSCLTQGIEYANDQQPDRDRRDPWFWADCCRYRTRETMRALSGERWTLKPSVPNYGVHVRVEELHMVRVVRSLDGYAPHAGRNPKRRKAWKQEVQGQLALDDRRALPPLSVIIDWHESEDERPVLHAGIPLSAGKMGTAPTMMWRVPLDDPGDEIGYLRFDPGPDDDTPLVTLHIDEADVKHLNE